MLDVYGFVCFFATFGFSIGHLRYLLHTVAGAFIDGIF